MAALSRIDRQPVKPVIETAQSASRRARSTSCLATIFSILADSLVDEFARLVEGMLRHRHFDARRE